MSDNQSEEPVGDEPLQNGLPPVIWISLLVAITILVLIFLLKRA